MNSAIGATIATITEITVGTWNAYANIENRMMGPAARNDSILIMISITPPL
jgi:hypothetical protein